MNQNSTNEFYNDIVNMAKEIIDKLGHELCNGDEKEYEEDKLKICRNKENIQIYLNKLEVLSYNDKRKQIYYINGKWTDTIKSIYNQIPIILYEKKLEEENIQRKSSQLQELSDYYKYYIENYNEKEIDSSLANYEIYINKEERYYNINNKQKSYYVFVIYYQNKKVAEFNDNESNLFPNFNEYLEEYIPGTWTTIFKKVIEEVKEKNNVLIR